MRIPWWQSIRWRLAIGSVLVVLLATALVVLTAVGAIIYYYGGEQALHTSELAADQSQRIGQDYALTGRLRTSVANVLPASDLSGGLNRQYLIVVFDRQQKIAYSNITTKPIQAFLNRFSNNRTRTDDRSKLHMAVVDGLDGKIISDELGRGQPFVVYPILAGGQTSGKVVGALLVVPRAAVEQTVPPFIADVGGAVLIASPFIALLVAIAALLFSRTITRPLAKLTQATRGMAGGDYNIQVKTAAQGELGELAATFNEMAAQLNRDVEELRRQELWRRELIMSVTHDLATPLTAIAGLGEALVDGVNQSRDDYEATGRIIVRETLRLRRLVKDLHMMAKVEAGALHPQKKPVRLSALVDEVLAVFATEFERAQVEPRNTVPYNLPSVQADPDMLTRVISNLCDNALKYTPAGGSIIIEAMPYRDMLAVSVTDTGKGIPAEALPRIFERFFRADSARRSTTGGSGLGLAIVRAIIEAHGGRVWAGNASGAGARIIFTLPLQVGVQSTITTTPTASLPPTRLHMLPTWRENEPTQPL